MSEEDALKENLLGNNAYDKRDFPKAISHYEKAISLNPREMSRAKENCKGDTKDEANSSKKRSFAEMLGELGPKIFSSKSDSTSEDDSDCSEDENVIRFKVLGGGSCSLSYVERAVSMMLDVDEMVVPVDRKSISVVFDYPLKDKFVFELESPSGKGFTRGELATAIATKYREIYQEEEETSSLPVETMSERSARLGGVGCNLINRAKTEGKYGIWGHELGDLALDEVTFCPEDNRYYLDISS